MVNINKSDDVRAFLSANSYNEQYNDGLLAFLRDYYDLPYHSLPDLLSRYMGQTATTNLPSLVTNLVDGALPSEFTFARSSTGAYYNSAGLLVTAAIDTPRIAYQPDENTVSFTSSGLLFEGGTTNQITYSEDLTNAAWGKTNTTISANAGVAPDGETTADAVIENAGTGSKILSYATIGTVTAGDFFTYSLFAKQGPGSTRYIRSTISGTALSGVQNAAFSLVSGIHSSNGTDAIRTRSFLLPNDWFRFEFTVQASSNGTIALTNRNTTTFSLSEGSFTGDGVSGTYQWGHQGSIDKFGSSYIKTEASTVTRSADELSIAGGDFSSLFNTTEGTFVVAATNIFDYTGTYFSVDDGTANDEMSLTRDSSDNTAMTITDGGAAQMSETLSGNTESIKVRMALAYKENDCQMSVNGVDSAIDSSVTLPTVDRIRFGLPTTTNFYLRCFAYFDTRITNLSGHTK